MEKKQYKVSLTKRYQVTFAKDGVCHKKGDMCQVSMMVAAKLASDGRIVPSADLLADAKEYGCEELFNKAKKQ